MVKKIKFLSLLMAMVVAFGVNAQITTSSMSGSVVDSSKEPLLGATIMVKHVPSGTSYGAVANVDGRFNIQGMRVGGPYTVSVSYIGYQTTAFEGIILNLGETYELNVEMKEQTSQLDEVVVVAAGGKFTTAKTGAATNISNAQIKAMPTVNRSITDIAKLSPYANGMSFAGGDGRSTNFTIDGANFNNNFGLSSALPGGGNPVSMEALEEVQVVIAPFDVRQTNFIGGGVNAITKSGTNTYQASAYYYFRNQEMRGNRINGKDLGARADEQKKTYGFTLGGPILKDKLFYFVNFEKEVVPGEVIKYRAREDGETPGGMVSRTTLADMKRVSDHLKSKYGYDPGSYTNFPADESNVKFLARIDWNIIQGHKLSLRYNYTKNTAWNAPNGNSSDTGYRLNNTYRVGTQSMAFANSMYSMDNKVQTWSADLHSRFSDKVSNQLLFTYSDIEDIRGSKSDIFPHIDIMNGWNANGTPILEPYMTAGYELFTYNNGVINKITNITDNVTFYAGNHEFMGGFRYEHQFANNSYMRNGTAYYRYNSVDDFINGAAPESFAITYGWNGNTHPTAQVTFNTIGLYLQDKWQINKKFMLNYGVRFDNMMFDDKDIATNKAIYDITFRDGQKIDTGIWPSSKWQISPRVGFSWDVKGDKSLKVRGGTGLFAGRLPLVFFTNMPTNSNMVQNSVQFKTNYTNGVPTSHDARLDQLAGGMITDVQEIIKKFNLPTEISDNNHVSSNKIAGCDKDFKMPQVWKSSIAVDYQLPVSFPLTVTGEFTYTKNVQAVVLDNLNIGNSDGWERFSGADNRLIYPASTKGNVGVVDATGKAYTGVATLLTNTSKGHGYTANITINARPFENLSLMAAYTHTESKEVSGLPGSDPTSTWQGLYTIDGPNFATVQRSQYVVPDRLIASVSWRIPFKNSYVFRGTNLNLFYQGYSANGNSWVYTNDMNGDGISNDLMYIPANDSEINFKTADDRKAFWAFVEQDGYLKSHKGKYAEAYAARAPWVHQFDLSVTEDIQFKIGKTKHDFQLSLTIMNLGNMFNSKWGVPKTSQVCNYSKILKYEGKDANNVPTFSMYKINGEYPTQTWDYNTSYSNCWRIQVGIKYMFN